jgi:acetylornithine/succinyldiaminopimelate/putrescine aminotransferase
MSVLKKLEIMRNFGGTRATIGLSDSIIEKFSKTSPDLNQAVEIAFKSWENLKSAHGDLLKLNELDLVHLLQKDYVNFYKVEALNPYVPLAGKGPWAITAHGAVVYDCGGYGMLGQGQGPSKIIEAMSENVFMANIMTANFSHKKFADKMFQEIGQTRPANLRKPFEKFICMNSGSEGMTVASRISDIQAKIMTDPGGKHAGKKIRFLSQRGSFHGRTERPAKVSDSSRPGYSVLASYREDTQLDIVEAGNSQHLKEIFAKADKDGLFYEAMFIEPVMGEGNPGKALPREFYDLARKLTKERGTILIVDSIQAGIRATGYLSVCDYPGFQDCEAPDMECYSKALNAGQYPLSVLALTSHAASLYKKGVYGNTMTTNPRALEVACAVLDALTPKLRENIRKMGELFVTKFKDLQREFPKAIVNVQGTGLLFSVELAEPGYTVLSKNCVELDLRKAGIGVIHGGKNALRFTPHFAITKEEVDLIVDCVKYSLAKGPIFTT